MADAAPVGLILAGASVGNRRVMAIDDHRILDEEILKRIRLMESEKDAAVAAENYDEAKRLKAAMQRIRLLTQEMSELEL